MTVHHRIRRIGKLLRDKDIRIFSFHLLGKFQALIDRFSDVAVVVDQLDLGAVMLDEVAALAGDGVRHDDDRLVSSNCTDQRQADALISGRRLHDDRVLGDLAVFLRLLDHVERGTGLDGTSHIQAFVFHKHAGTVLTDHAGGQPDHRCMPDGF